VRARCAGEMGAAGRPGSVGEGRVEQAVISVPNDAAKTAAGPRRGREGRGRAGRLPGAAVAAAAKAARAAAAARAKASFRHQDDAYAGGCNPFMLKLGACRSESGLAGPPPAQVKQSLIGAAMVLTSPIPVGDIFGGLTGLFDAVGAAADATEATEAGRTAPSADETVTAVLLHPDIDLYNLTVKDQRRHPGHPHYQQHLF
jgi:hypothetical protein